MSRDQKPGRIRVVSSGRATAPAAVAAPAENDASSAADPSTEIAADARARRSWAGALVFIGGCAAGGAGVVALLRGF